MDIVIDFDGTCVTHAFPAVGREIGATAVLRRLVAAGHNLILSTMRSDQKRGPALLSDAVEWFSERDIPLLGVQVHPEQSTWTSSPKAYGDLYIDDRALGCPLIHPEDAPPYVDWPRIEQLLTDYGLLPGKD